MSVESENQSMAVDQVEMTQELPKKNRISYTRKFLLSISKLDVCKELPKGFDPSILSEFGEASSTTSEWQRPPGSFSSESGRRGEFGSSPPSRLESSNYSRGVHGKWDSHSSGSNDRDLDSQSDKSSDSGKPSGNQPRRPWQNPEHDGLLGRGSFSRPSGGYAAGASASKGRGNGQYQLNKTNEPYQPPRPYKAVPHSRRDITDSINDETFGSSEQSNEDREEEERKRRASFEMFRKENQKTYKEKKNHLPDKHSEDYDPDIAALLKDSENKRCDKIHGRNDLAQPASQSNSAISSQTPTHRPVVPPGFRKSVLDKNLITDSLVPQSAIEGGSTLIGNNTSGTSDTQDDKNPATCTDSSLREYESKTSNIPLTDKVSEKKSSDIKGSERLSGVDHSSSEASRKLEIYKGQGEGVNGYDKEKAPEDNLLDTTGQEPSASILDKLFDGAVTNNDVKEEEPEIKMPYKSSKFRHWFDEEREEKEDFSSNQPKDLLSLLVGADNDKSPLSVVSSKKTSELVHPTIPFKGNEPVQKFVSSPPVEIYEAQLHPNDAAPRVITCEDLEQSILSEINESSSCDPTYTVHGKGFTNRKPEVNSFASQHILSLLQKSTCLNDSGLSANLNVQSSDSLHVYEQGSITTVSGSGQVGEVQNSDRPPTLETLFGESFMKELQSVQAPVSLQRGSVGGVSRAEFSGPHEFPFPVADDSYRPPHVNEHGLSNNNNNNLGSDFHRNGVGFNHTALGGSESGPDSALEIQLPEDIPMSDARKHQNPTFMHGRSAIEAEPVSSSTAHFDIVHKLAALNATFKDKRSTILGHDGRHILGGPYNHVESEIPYQNVHGQTSSPLFPHLQMNHGGPLVQQLDSHHTRMNPQMKFMGPESITRHEQPQHQFAANAFHHPSHHPSLQHSSRGQTRFDPPAQNHLLQHMHVPGHFLPPHLLQGNPRDVHMLPHSINQMAGQFPAMDPTQGFHLHRQPSYGGIDMPVIGPGVGGSTHPEALTKLIEMELRANPKQMHPVGTGNYGPHEVDMGGLRYR